MPRSERPDMAAYGVPDELDGVLPWSWADERLAANRNFWVTTVDPAGRPHTMPVWGWWDADAEQFWFSCAAEAFKARNLAANPAVVVAIDGTVEVVSIEGDAARIDGGAPEAQAAGRAWGLRYAEDIEVKVDGVVDEEKLAEAVGFFTGGAVFCVSPRKAFGLIERPDDFGPKATRWVW